MNKRRAKILVIFFTMPFLAWGIFILWQVKKLPDHLPPMDPYLNTKIVDRNDRPLQSPLSLRGERLSPLDLSEIPVVMQSAFLLAEDQRFYGHRGVDTKAMFRAFVQTIINFRPISGASTITMQLVRIHWPGLRGLIFKPVQMIQAARIEKRHRKGEILNQYFNLIPFAYQVSGVGQACPYFFDKECWRLSLAESSALAVIPRNPALYSRNLEALKKSRNRLITKVADELSFDPLVVDQALNEKIVLQKHLSPFEAPHLVWHIQSELAEGKRVQTTLDLSLQTRIQERLSETVRQTPKRGDHAAILVVHNKTAEVLAYIGSPEFLEPNHGMVDGTRSLRSPGSALKPFVYARALEKGWNLSSILPDVPIQFKIPRGVFVPRNYGQNFSGPRQFRFALGNSQNIPALYLTHLLGEGDVLHFLRQMGLDVLDEDESFYGIGLSLGNGEVNLWQLVQAYSTLARLGVFQNLHYYPQKESFLKRVLSEPVAYQIADVLSDPHARVEEFGRWGPLEFDYRVAVKTGTSSDFRDHWTVGYTPDFTVGIWRGNADGRPIHEKIPAAHNTGVLFHEIMDLLYKDQRPRWYPRPEGLDNVRVCSLSGQKPGDFCHATRREIFENNKAPNEICNMHQSIQIPSCRGKPREIFYVQLPPQYATWQESEMGGGSLPTLAQQLKEKCGMNSQQIHYFLDPEEPAILEPLNEMVLALDPTMPRDHQKLRLSLANTLNQKDLFLYINGQVFQKVSDKQEVYWPLERGQFAFELGNSSEPFTSQAIHITVL